MVPDLQHVDGAHPSAGQQPLLDRRLRVAREQGGEPVVAHDQHDRGVVDVVVGERGRRLGGGRVEHLDGGPGTQAEPIARARKPGGHPRPRRIGEQAIVGRVLVGNAGVEDQADVEAGEHLDEAGHVVLVRVAHDQDVDAARVEGQLGTEPAQRPFRVRPAVDEQPRPARSLDQDRIALADVEDGEVEPAVGAGDERDAEQQPGRDGADRDRSPEVPHQARHVGVPVQPVRRRA